MIKGRTGTRRRPRAQITLERASRLHHFVSLLGETPRPRDELLSRLAIGLRTFYRELELLKRLSIRIRFENRRYRLLGPVEAAAGDLPFPDPQLNFKEMKELSEHPGPAAERLRDLLDTVLTHAPPARKKRRPTRRRAGE